MARNHASAKKAGTAFERSIANALATHIDDRIDRRAKTGAKDRGDIGGLRHHGQRVTLECKNTTRIALAAWAAEAETERINDDNALAGLVVHKRQGKGDPLDQWVTCTLRELIALINGNRAHTAAPE